MKKSREHPSFSPETGVLCYDTVREQFRKMLDDGYFDRVTSFVLATSNDTSMHVRRSENLWECSALAAYADKKLFAEYEGGT
jgi:hypothetical protein